MPVSVRPAQILDAPALAAIQRACWHQLYDTTLGSLASAIDTEEVTSTWGAAINMDTAESPYSVFVATDASQKVVGFAALAPCFDPDAGPGFCELVALYVLPEHQRAGHGSRLLNAIAATGRAAKAKRLSCWVYAGDFIRQRFLKQVGFGADGSERSWKTPERDYVDEARWSTLLDQPAT
ncbi:MAG: GNAT family N-acetyltransferase [Micrococcales bacterium]|nr:GNAT family N-acetyltransferase [Micrococcales bacterium]